MVAATTTMCYQKVKTFMLISVFLMGGWTCAGNVTIYENRGIFEKLQF